MSKFIIERNIPSVGHLSGEELKRACQKSNDTIMSIDHRVQWQQSYVTNDKLYCVYLAKSKDAVMEHAEKSGFPANRIEEVKKVIDPTSGE
jgi:hypothetical protein